MTKAYPIILLVATLAAYLSVYVSPATFWLAGFFSLTIPVLLIANLLLLLLYAVRRRWQAVYPLAALLVGYPYIAASVVWQRPSESASPAFSVLSYNVRVFNIYSHQQRDTPRPTVTWLTQEDADVKCLQEFYNDDSSAVFNATQRLREQGTYHSYVNPSLINRIGAQFGLAIFSRFPILNRGEVSTPQDSLQYAIFADLRTPGGVVRVYNVHLRSMSIDENTLGDQGAYPSIARKLKNGFTTRAHQVDALLSHLRASPHPVVVCGDLNDLPYSYTYFSLRDQLMSSFEEAGRGFGFSYNGKLFFLRIDNQFFGEELQAHRFTTYREVDFSDHFPVKAEYSFR
ncbi:MAG: endonuclease/exonuclease/phosphatase family protein [Tunicatimonas sp.]